MRGLFALTFVLVCTLFASTTARAQQPSPEAAKHFTVGLKLYQEKAFVEALAEFELAYKLSNRPNALKNIAQCHRELKHFADAYESFDKLLVVHGSQLGADKPAVEHALAELTILTGTISITSSQPDALVSLDGRPLGTTPLDKPKRVNLGTHTIKVTKAGFETFDKEVSIGSEQTAQLDVKLEVEITTGHVSVHEQSGRDVHLFVDGLDSGPLPWSGELSPGDHTLEAKSERFASDKQSVKITPKEKLDLVLDAAPTRGHLRVSVTPSNAKIQMDGADHGTGQWEADVSPGSHRITVSLDGYPDAVREVTVEKGQLAVAEIALVGAIANVAREPVYKGFYGRWSIPFWFGFGTGYVPPVGSQLTLDKKLAVGLHFKLQFGYSFGWFGIEGVGVAGTNVRNDSFVDPSGTEQVKGGGVMFSAFLGVGARATSKHRVARVTGGVALGVAPHQMLGPSSDAVKSAPCSNNSPPPGVQCSGSDGNAPSPGYTSAALAGDFGLQIGPAPGAKLWIGIDWRVDFAPTLFVRADARLPPQYTTNGGAIMMQGPQFYIGPVLGGGFGH